MKAINRYTKHCSRALTIAAAALTLLTTASCRRDLWVYQDNFKQVELDVDWRNYFRDQQLYPNTPDPDGMTVWFFPKDGRTSMRYTTSEVRHFETYLSKGDYEALVIDYSPAEYGRQEFIGMDYANTAEVRSLPSTYQPDSLAELYGQEAYGRALPSTQPKTGFYTISYEPEVMASDTCDMTVTTGKYDKYIPYKERDDYQSTLTHQVFQMEPIVTPWRMRVRIYIKGFYYLYQTKGSIAGLADGYYLAEDRTSDTPCLLTLDDWEYHTELDSNQVSGGLGYIAKTFYTWGLTGSSNRQHLSKNSEPRPADDIRVNLRFLLRDRKTVVNYHFDLGDCVRTFWNEYALRIDLDKDDPRIPDLPFVEAYNGIEFDGIVVPWEDEHEVNIGF